MAPAIIHYLALGDSYTIGEAVPLEQNFPNRLWQLCREAGIPMEKPRIIARTGWTTDELFAAIAEAQQAAPFLPSYELVTLLIGVNNQYRGRDLANYAEEFEILLDKALAFVGNKKENLLVLSIPDWGVTPFAEGRDQEQIAREIDAYNEAAKLICSEQDIHYIYITGLTREAANDPSLLAPDGLHPSGKEYDRWSRKILDHIKNIYRG